ncbi:MAG: hypothetical protein HONDAALG_03904 [Gammaproteobacteria bacterium]|nr:hypothetical protein [Gammaproteobacteria bacterium]
MTNKADINADSRQGLEPNYLILIQVGEGT